MIRQRGTLPDRQNPVSITEQTAAFVDRIAIVETRLELVMDILMTVAFTIKARLDHLHVAWSDVPVDPRDPDDPGPPEPSQMSDTAF
jgi:hypothetical protein